MNRVQLESVASPDGTPSGPPPGAPSRPAPPSPILPALQGLLLLGLVGVSLGLGLGLCLLRDQLAAYVGENRLDSWGRRLIAASMLSCAVAAAGLGGLHLYRRRDAAALRSLALRMSPLALAGFLPLLLHGWAWTRRDLLFLVLVGCWTLGLVAALRAAQQPVPSADCLDAKCPSADGPTGNGLPTTLVVATAGLAYAAYFAFHTIAYHRNILTRSFDLGIFDNLMWNLVHGGPMFKATPVLGPTGSHLQLHATFMAYAFAPFYALVPRPETLLLMQALLIGAAAVPLFLFARRHVGEWAACLVALAYLLYPPAHGANLYDFHFLSTSPLFLWSALWLFEERRDGRAALAVLASLATREDVAAGVVVLGLYLTFSGRRPRAGIVVSVVGAGYFTAMKFGIMPMFGTDAAFLPRYKGLLPDPTGGFAGVLATVFTNPAFTLGTLLDVDKLVYVLQILTPLAFLPLRRPLNLVFFAPGFFFTLLATGYAPLIQISFQYTAHWTAFMFPAAVLGLAAVGGVGASDAAAIARRRAWLGALLGATLVCSYQYGAILSGHGARGGFDIYKFGTTAKDLDNRRALATLLAQLPPRATVVASERLVPQVSSRPNAYTLRVGAFDAEFVLFPVDRRMLFTPRETEPLRALLRGGDYGVIAVREPFALAQRGQTPTANAAVLDKLGLD